MVWRSRPRKRNNPEQVIDLHSGGFAGLVYHMIHDRNVYKAFARTDSYERLRAEYVCEFKRSLKNLAADGENTPWTKWTTAQLEFSDFQLRM